MNRREFLKRTAALAALAASGDTLAASLPGSETSIPRRALGSTGVTVSVLGFPGTAVMDVEQTVANDLVARAFERGVDFYDVSPSYGNAQERLGPALEPFRERCFLASKTDARFAEEATQDLDKSLRVLRTDSFDLFQHHAVTRTALEEIALPGGAMEAFLAAKKAGKVRYLGLSTHSLGVALEAMETLPLDTIMFPVSHVLYTKVKIGPQVVERARAKKMGILAIKAMARGKYPPGAQRVSRCWYEPCGSPEEAALAWRWSVSQDIDVNVPPGNPELFQLALGLAQRHRPLSPEEDRRLVELSDGATPLFTFTEP